jgi:hypothetical protein
VIVGSGATIRPRAADGGTIVAFAQAAAYFLTGIWPLVSMRTFEAVTGEKTDDRSRCSAPRAPSG